MSKIHKHKQPVTHLLDLCTSSLCLTKSTTQTCSMASYGQSPGTRSTSVAAHATTRCQRLRNLIPHTFLDLKCSSSVKYMCRSVSLVVPRSTKPWNPTVICYNMRLHTPPGVLAICRCHHTPCTCWRIHVDVIRCHSMMSLGCVSRHVSTPRQ